MRVSIVDVFAEQRYAGNQLAVVRDAAELDTETMQRIALEMNFSETTFVVAEREDPRAARVRIFTPHLEIPFAGHPTIGTAWVVAHGNADTASPAAQVTLNLQIGDVVVDFDRSSGIAWMTPPLPSFSDGLDSASAADSLSLSRADLDEAWPRRFADIGPCFHFIAVNTLDALGRARMTPGDFDRLFPDHERVGGVFIYCAAETHDENADYAARMFFQSGGVVREDPATGSANSAFTALLRDHLGAPLRAVVDQGVEMGRPSRIYLEADLTTLRIGGRVQPVLEGTLA